MAGADVAMVGLGLGVAYLAYKQIKSKGRALEEYQAGLFKESDMAKLEGRKTLANSHSRSEPPDPSLDHWVPEQRGGPRMKRNRPTRVSPDTKPMLF